MNFPLFIVLITFFFLQICADVFIVTRVDLNLTASLWFLCLRSEIDRLTALLRSRTVGEPLDNEQDRSEEIPSNQLAFHERKEPVLNTPVKENGIVSTHNFSPVVSSNFGNFLLFLHLVLVYINRSAFWWFCWYSFSCICIYIYGTAHFIAAMLTFDG